MPAKNDDALQQLHRGVPFAGKPGSYSAKNDNAVQQLHRSVPFDTKQ
ncbi:hypothetical protein OH720_12845 [Pseudomonas sp. WJP1]|nr:hypothetical protein [Pseudomonas sp. WJP1]WCM53852.1 hypothetical protein OH720_12845 [Pseudomonas sp. WJP1]